MGRNKTKTNHGENNLINHPWAGGGGLGRPCIPRIARMECASFITYVSVRNLRKFKYIQNYGALESFDSKIMAQSVHPSVHQYNETPVSLSLSLLFFFQLYPDNQQQKYDLGDFMTKKNLLQGLQVLFML